LAITGTVSTSDAVTQDKPHVTLVPVKKNNIAKLTETGIVTEDGTLHEVDIIALATGFDSVTGGLKALDVTGLNGEVLAKKWEMGTWTYLGMTVRFVDQAKVGMHHADMTDQVANFPNFFVRF
jgi:cation diffusion facilitator CzcD-associated flavoprotein CzcO